MCERMNEKQIFLKILRILSGSHLLFVQLIADDKKRNFGEFDEIRCVTATHLSCPQNNTHKGVFKCTPFHVLPEHTLASYLNTPWCVPKTHLKVVFRACPKFDSLSGVFCRKMCFVTLLDV